MSCIFTNTSFVLFLFVVSAIVLPVRTRPVRFELTPIRVELETNGQSSENSQAVNGDTSLNGEMSHRVWKELCHRDEDCGAPRKCKLLTKKGTLKPCTSGNDCTCETPLFNTCLSDSECPAGERCERPIKDSIGACLSQKDDEGISSHTQNVLTTPVQSTVIETKPNRSRRHHIVLPSPSSLPPPPLTHETETKSEAQPTSSPETMQAPPGGSSCIGIDALSGFARHELVFEEDREESVLCDRHGSCATPGHIIVVNGEALMMSSYCKQVTCFVQVMMVNTPRFRRYLRIKSFTEGLQFTPYSARYGTYAEELLFDLLSKLGM